MTSNSGGVGSLPDTGSRKCSGQASPAQDREGPWRGLLVPLTGLFRGCEGRCGNAGTQGVFQCDVRIAYCRPQSSSASRLTAGASGFFIFSQSGERPER
jgi:hypothetical protein